MWKKMYTWNYNRVKKKNIPPLLKCTTKKVQQVVERQRLSCQITQVVGNNSRSSMIILDFSPLSYCACSCGKNFYLLYIKSKAREQYCSIYEIIARVNDAIIIGYGIGAM